MTIIVKKVTQLLAGVIFLYGLYIMVHGHLTPGGGFAGGTIMVGPFILLILAYGSDVLKLKKDALGSKTLESFAILLFLITATIGFFIGLGIFFKNYLPTGVAGDLVSAGIIPICNIVVGFEVAAAILSIFLALCIYKDEVSK